jgi:hypothetical protein
VCAAGCYHFDGESRRCLSSTDQRLSHLFGVMYMIGGGVLATESAVLLGVDGRHPGLDSLGLAYGTGAAMSGAYLRYRPTCVSR